MLGLSLRYLRKNKRQSLTIIIGIVLSSILLFSVGILFSSFREFLINKTLENNDYHVRIKGYISDDKNIISLKEKNGEYYVKFKDIKKTYDYTDMLCHTEKCLQIHYNTRLLSLYGIGENNYLELFSGLIISIVFILAISVFFIIYNCFQVILTKKKKDMFLLLSSGASKGQVCKIFFTEEIICGILGIILGLVISIIFNIFMIGVINSLFFEFLNGKLFFYFYIPFIIIPFLFMIIITVLASLLPLIKIRKWRVISLVKSDDIDKKITIKKAKNFVWRYALTNYERGRRKYKGIIMCIFILIILFNSFMILFKDMTVIFNRFIKLPKYDVALNSSLYDYDKLDDFTQYLKADKKVVFKTCERQFSILNGDYSNSVKNNLLITNLGGNKLVNRVVNVTLKNNKMYNIDYKPFNSLKEIQIGKHVIRVGLTDKIPFGLENELLEGRYILNLNDDEFDLVCSEYEGRAFIKTKTKGLDQKISEYAKKNDFYDLSYVNTKKGYEFINNCLFILKLFMIICLLIIVLIALFAFFNILSACIKIRKKEFATLKSLGFTNGNISLCLLAESFIISGKGCFYALPFVLLINRYLYVSFSKYFDINFISINYKIFLIGFIFILLLVFLSMLVCHFRLYKFSLINNIKDDKF